MKKAPRKKVAGVGTAMGAVIFGSLLFACAPGSLPCDKDDEWKGICKGDGGGGTTPSGTGGSNNQTGGSNGGGTGGAGGNAPTALTKDTPVADCGDIKTVGQMDMFFEMKCGSGGAACHGMNAPWGDFRGMDMWMRGTTVKTKFACKDTPLADPMEHTKGAFFAKINGEARCGGMPGVMPPANASAMQKLSDAEKTCLTNFLKAVAGGK